MSAILKLRISLIILISFFILECFKIKIPYLNIVVNIIVIYAVFISVKNFSENRKDIIIYWGLFIITQTVIKHFTTDMSIFRLLFEAIGGVIISVIIVGIIIRFFSGSSSLNFDDGMDKFNLGSRFNPRKATKGTMWTYADDLKEFTNDKNKTVFIDNFCIYPDIYSRLNEGQLKNAEKFKNIKVNFKPLDFTKTMLILGKMGSGKTEFIISIARQNKFNRMFVNCVKDDLMQALYKEGDIIYNPYSANSANWDIWAEMNYNETVALAFFKNLVLALTAKNGGADFWSNRASQIVNELLIDIWQDNVIDNQTSAQKWLNFAKELALKIDLMIKDGDTQASLAATMQIITQIVNLLAWRAQDETVQTFTLTDFYNGDKNLFMLNNPAYADQLTPLFAGFCAAATSILLGRPDTKTDLTLFVLDEYFSLTMDEQTQKQLLTMARSKGGCVMLAAQMLPKDNKKIQQLIDSSRYALFAFSVTDDETVRHICGSFGEVEYQKIEYSTSSGSSSQSGKFGGGRSSNDSYSIKEKKGAFLAPELLNAQMPQYHHLTICPDDNLLYLGYTPLEDFTPSNVCFEKINVSDMYKFVASLKS